MTFAQKGAALATALATLLPMPADAGGVELTSLEQSFLREINTSRAAYGRAPVRIDTKLVRAARFHSTDMVRRGFFAHGVFTARLRHFGVTDGYVGEDLGWDSRLASAVHNLLAMWLKSQPHRDVLLGSRYRIVGIGVATGPFEGYAKAIVVTADFQGP
jgi:uncharacterized protein YkwD